MSAASVDIDTSALERDLRDLGRDIADVDWGPAVAETALYLEGAAKLCFDEGHAPDGSPWAALKHPRVNSKGDDKPLRNTDVLMASMTAASAQGAVRRFGDAELTYGTNLDYAATHQFGDPNRVPTTAKFLAIPLTKEAARYERALDFPRKLFVLRSKSENKAFLAEDPDAEQGPRDPDRKRRRGKKHEIIRHYVLKRSVVIPARPFQGITQEMANDIGEIAVEHAMKG